MPLLSPSQIHSVLKPLTTQERKLQPKSENELETLLVKSNLTKEEILDNLSTLMRCAEQDSTRLKASEIGLKLNGLLSGDDADRSMSVTIIINDPQYSTINPILIPR